MPTENQLNYQTIDSVPRDLLQKIADGGYCHQRLMDRLRALLVTPVPTPIDYGSLDAVQRLELCRGDKPAPVAVVLPGRMVIPESERPERTYAQGWNACLDEVTRLNNKSPHLQSQPL